MNRDTFLKIAELGFEVGVVSDNLCRVYLNTVPSREMILRLFELLGENDEICFWNRYYFVNPTPGDPGSMIGAVIYKGLAYYHETRLDVQSETRKLSFPDMADMIIRNWNDTPVTDDVYRNAVFIRYNSYTGRAAKAEYYMPDIRFDGWMDFADRIIFLGFSMCCVFVFLMTLTVKEQLFIPIILTVIFLAGGMTGLYMRLEYNRTARPWRWKKRVRKNQDYKLILKYKGETTELKSMRQAGKMLDDYFASNGSYDIEVNPPMGGIAGLSGYYVPRMKGYALRFRTITENGEQYRYFAVVGRSREDYFKIKSLLRKKRIGLENYGYWESWNDDRPFIEAPRNDFREVIPPANR